MLTFIAIKTPPAFISTPAITLYISTQTISMLVSIMFVPSFPTLTPTIFAPTSQRPKVASIGEEDDKENDFQLSYHG